MQPGQKRLTAYEAIETAKLFADLLREQDYVDKIVLEEVGWERFRVWTVLSSPPFEDQYSEPVYEAQAKILERLSEPAFDFRVINVNELDGRLEGILPANGHLLYEHSVAA